MAAEQETPPAVQCDTHTAHLFRLTEQQKQQVIFAPAIRPVTTIFRDALYTRSDSKQINKWKCVTHSSLTAQHA